MNQDGQIVKFCAPVQVILYLYHASNSGRNLSTLFVVTFWEKHHKMGHIARYIGSTPILILYLWGTLNWWRKVCNMRSCAITLERKITLVVEWSVYRQYGFKAGMGNLLWFSFRHLRKYTAQIYTWHNDNYGDCFWFNYVCPGRPTFTVYINFVHIMFSTTLFFVACLFFYVFDDFVLFNFCVRLDLLLFLDRRDINICLV